MVCNLRARPIKYGNFVQRSQWHVVHMDGITLFKTCIGTLRESAFLHSLLATIEGAGHARRTVLRFSQYHEYR